MDSLNFLKVGFYSASVSICLHASKSGACGGQKTAFHALGMEFQAVVSHHVGTGYQLKYSERGKCS